ncbi:MAG TPA: coenzyme F420-0:L-glutamate ligase, partial [Candidatus Limnocylindrales bacterium]|nr:coenzyme F420-0:L-glutamate ligase [Candidatus Limnocylindrales bacterium]
MKRVELVGLDGIAEIHTGESLGQLICDACERQQFPLADGDILVVAQKIVSKAEGQMIALATVKPSARAQELASE